MLGEILVWWAQQLRDLVPERLRGGPDGIGDALILKAESDSRVELIMRRNRRERSLGHFLADQPTTRRLPLPTRRPGLIVLLVPSGRLLEREVTLPLAAERDIESVLHYEMDRLTPFGPDDVYWAAQVVQRDRATARLMVRLSLIPRAVLQPLLEVVARFGLRPAVIEAARPIGPPCRIALAHEATRAQRLRRAGLVAAAGACAALALTAILVPLVRQSIALADTDTQIAALQPRVTEAETLRNRIAARTSGADVIAAESARLGSALQAIAALTDILPDDTYLTTLSMRQRQLTLNGSSAAAAKLIGALSADPLMRNPTFAAPVTRSENGKSDLFSIRAELRS